uniref:Uncharacterized protein n=1 Tax=Panagrolaimus sp. ES5 TaxID=591445 RepID=A0AC34G533_9BILA
TEALFEELIKSSEEYTAQNVKDILINKKHLLSVLKTHRPIKLRGYQYGLSERKNEDDNEKNRLIVSEWDDKRMCRDYSQVSQRKHLWECLKCHRIQQKKKKEERAPRTFLYLYNDIVFVPILHECPPKDYKHVMEYQKHLLNGNLKAARSMTQRCDFDFKESSSLDDDDAKFVPKLKRRSNDADDLRELQPPDNKKDDDDAKFVPKLKRRSNDADDLRELQPPDNKKTKHNVHLKAEEEVKRNEIPKSETILSFKKPSISLLKEICKKLNIGYRVEATKFWETIELKEINIASKNIHSTAISGNFYKILSYFFTGKFGDYNPIYYAINMAFGKKLIAEGEMSGNEINLLCRSFKITEKHFKFITKFLSCKILIFDFNNNNNVKKYGDWKNDNNAFTLVLSFSNRKYSIVVNL